QKHSRGFGQHQKERFVLRRRLPDENSYIGRLPLRTATLSGCIGAILRGQCPLWVKSGHRGISNQCPLYPQKRTLIEHRPRFVHQSVDQFLWGRTRRRYAGAFSIEDIKRTGGQSKRHATSTARPLLPETRLSESYIFRYGSRA